MHIATRDQVLRWEGETSSGSQPWPPGGRGVGREIPWVGKEEEEEEDKDDGGDPQGAGFLFGAQSGISTGEGLGLISLRKHRKKEPRTGWAAPPRPRTRWEGPLFGRAWGSC